MGVEYARYLLPRPCSFRPSSETLVQLIEALRTERWLPSAATRNVRYLRDLHGRLEASVLGLVQRGASWSTADELRIAGLSRLPEPLTAAWLDANLDTRLLWPVKPDGDADDSEVDETDDTADLLWMLHGLRYPLDRMDDEGGPPYYDFSIHWAADYVVPVGGETMQTGTETECPCGEELERTENDFRRKHRAPFTTRIAADCPSCGRPFDPEQAITTLEDGWDKHVTKLRKGGVLHRFAIHVECGKCFPHSPPSPTFHPELKRLCEDILRCSMVEAGYTH
ncbi:MAG: hypothetical protein HOV80_02945 [Polyangiaceae bacterium]|nr:hypothetical protein [Polyangiaceae bacterium]